MYTTRSLPNRTELKKILFEINVLLRPQADDIWDFHTHSPCKVLSLHANQNNKKMLQTQSSKGERDGVLQD